MNLGYKVITFYFALTYIIPAIGNFIFSKNIETVFRTYPLDINGLVTIFTVYCLYLLLSKLNLNFINLRKFRFFEKFYYLANFYLRYRIYFSIFIFFFSCEYFYLGYSSHRYFAPHISHVGNPLLFCGMILHIFVIVELFHRIFHNMGKEISLKQKIENILLAFSSLLFADGTGNAIFALFFITFAFLPKTLMKLIINKNNNFISRLIKLLLSIILFSLIFLGGWIYGEAVKSTYSRGYLDILNSLAGSINGKPFKESFSSNGKPFKESFSSNGKPFKESYSNNGKPSKQSFSDKNSDLKKSFSYYAEKYFYYLIDRCSVHYYSFTYTMAMKERLPDSPILYPLNNLLFRLDYLFFKGKFGFERPKIPSICRLNHLLVSTVEINAKTGSSPGLLAAFNYVFKSPFNIIFCALYLCFISFIIDYFICQSNKKLSLFIIAFLYFFFSPFFASPFDYLIVFDGNFISLLIVATVAVSRKYMFLKKSHLEFTHSISYREAFMTKS